MALFMDVHNLEGGVSVEVAAAAHQANGDADAGTPDGCLNHTSPDAAIGAWSSVFQSNAENSAICGTWAAVEEAEAGFEFLAYDFVTP